MGDFSRYKLSFNEAKGIIEAYDCMNDTEFHDQIRHWAMFDVPDESYGSVYKDIRTEIVDTFKQVLEENDNKINYNLISGNTCVNQRHPFHFNRNEEHEQHLHIGIAKRECQKD